MDIEILLALQHFREATGNVLDVFFDIIRNFGEPTVCVVVTALLYWCIRKRSGQYLMLNFAVGIWLNQLLKCIFCVYRPWVRDARIQPQAGAMKTATGYSFPSGHTSTGGALLGGLAVTLRKHKVASVLCVVLWVLVAFSRNYMGVHTPQDTLVSFALGILLLWLTGLLMKYLDAHPAKDVLITVVGLAFCVAMVLFVSLKSYPMDLNDAGELLVDPAEMTKDAFEAAGAVAGFFIGWLLERRFIRFDETGGSTVCKVIRGAAGIVLLLALNLALGQLKTFMDATAAALIKNGLLILYVTAGYPALFKAVEGRMSSRSVGAAKAQ